MHVLSSSLSPSSLLNNYTAVNLVFKWKENCQLSSQIRQSLPYHSQVAKRCWACPWIVIFLCNEQLDLACSQLCGKNRQHNRAVQAATLVSTWFCRHKWANRTQGAVWNLPFWGFPCILSGEPPASKPLADLRVRLPAFWAAFLPSLPSYSFNSQISLLFFFSPQDTPVISCATTRSWRLSKE